MPGLRFVGSLLGITLITFALLRLAPGDPGAAQSGVPTSAQEQQAWAQWRQLQGLDAPAVESYLRWLGRVLSLDFGHSLVDQRPVIDVVAEAAPRTILLNGFALLVIYAGGIAIGLWTAARRGSAWDTLAGYALFGMYAVPGFSVALLALSTLGMAGLFSLRGLQSADLAEASLALRVLDGAWHLVLPVLCLAYVPLARVARVQRAAALEVASEDWVTVARAKGLSSRLVWRRHVGLAAMGPVLALLTLDLPAVVGGSVIVERIFSIRGVGMLLFDAILRRDYPVIMGVVTMVAVVTVVSLALGEVVSKRMRPRVEVAP